MSLKERFRRAWTWIMQKLTRRPAPTEGHLDQEAQTNTSIGLMARAASAGANITPEQQIFLSQSEHGMRERMTVLLNIPHRSLAQEREKVAIDQWLARASAPPQPVVRSFMGAAQANPLAALALNPMTWMAAGLALTMGWGTITTWRLNNAKGDLREERAENAALQRSLTEVSAINEQLAEAMRDADAQTRQTAANIEAERARRQRADRELRRIRDAMDQAGSDGPIDYGFGSVRDDERVSGAGGDSSPEPGNPR